MGVSKKRKSKVARDRATQEALDQLRQLKWSFSADFRFDREEINRR